LHALDHLSTFKILFFLNVLHVVY